MDIHPKDLSTAGQGEFEWIFKAGFCIEIYIRVAGWSPPTMLWEFISATLG